MLKGKRERAASFDASGDNDSQAQPLSKKKNEYQREGGINSCPLEIMLNLPQEILSTIFELACFSRPLPSSPAAYPPSSSQSDYDHDTTLSLLTSSRCLYAQVVPSIFRHVKVTRPSSLALLYKALLARPQLAKLVMRFEVGPEDELPARWWPLCVRDDPEDRNMACDWVANGIKAQEWDLLPHWCSPGQRATPTDFYQSCVGRHLFEAAQRAGADTNTSIQCARSGFLGGRPASSDGYIIKIFWIQAAFDFYLSEVRRIDDERATSSNADDTGVRGSHAEGLQQSLPQGPPDCITRRCGHYPWLAVTAVDPSSPHWPTSPNFFVVRLSDIHAHLARRGGPVDRFDHPLLFAKSRLKRYYISDSMRPQLEEQGPYLLPQGGSGTESLDPTSFGGVVGLVRAVMSRLPKTCRVEIRPKVLEESVKLGWEREWEGEEVEVVMAPPLRFALLANGLT